MNTKLEHLVEQVGGFGRFQLLLIPRAISSIFMAIWSTMFMVFGAVQPDWWCVSRGFQTNQLAFSNLSHGLQRNQSAQAILGEVGENVSMTFPTITEDGGSLDLNGSNGTTAGSCELLASDDGICDHIVFAPGLTTVVSEFHLVCDRAWVPSMTISLQMVGMLFGSIFGGQLGDSIGRKKSMVIFTAVHAILNLIAAFSITWQMFAVLSTLIGFTTGAIIVLAFPYPTEFIGVKRRAIMGTLPVWGIGSTTSSLLVWVLPHWSHVHIANAVCTAACLPSLLLLPESVRWLIVKGHVTQAHQVLCQMAKMNRRREPDIRSVQSLLPDTAKPHKKYSYVHLFSSWKLAKWSVLNGFMWFCCAVTYFGISFSIKNLSGDFHLNFFLMSIAEIPPGLTVYHLSGWFGRRWTIVGSYMMASLAVITTVPLSLLLTEGGSYINAMCFVCRMGVNLGWNTMALMLIEAYPTVIRNIAVGYCNTMSRVGAIVAPYILSAGEPYVFYSVISVGMTLTSLTPIFLPETRGQPLQDGLPVSSMTIPPPSPHPAPTDHRDGMELDSLRDDHKTSL